MSNSRLKIYVGFRVSNSEAIDDERVLFFQRYWLEVVGGKMYTYICIYIYIIDKQIIVYCYPSRSETKFQMKHPLGGCFFFKNGIPIMDNFTLSAPPPPLFDKGQL